MEAISTVFLPRFRGTLPNARSPLGARVHSRAMGVLCTPHSSTHTKSRGSTIPARPRKALSRSSRSEELRVFF